MLEILFFVMNVSPMKAMVSCKSRLKPAILIWVTVRTVKRGSDVLDDGLVLGLLKGSCTLF